MPRRLKTRAQFQAVLAAATVARTRHFALHRLELRPARAVEATGAHGAPSSPSPHPLFPAYGAVRCGWLGAMTPKRWARRAVTRNAIRRQIYALGALLDERLQDAAHVVRLRAAFDRTAFPSATSDALKQAVRAELQQLFARFAGASAASASASRGIPASPE